MTPLVSAPEIRFLFKTSQHIKTRKQPLEDNQHQHENKCSDFLNFDRKSQHLKTTKKIRKKKKKIYDSSDHQFINHIQKYREHKVRVFSINLANTLCIGS